MQSGIRGGFGLLKNLVQRAGGARQARQLLQSVRQVLPAAEMTGVRGISEPVRRAAVQAGLVDELTAFPSVVSQQGGNLGAFVTGRVPTSRQLGQAPVPQWGTGSRSVTPPVGSRNVNTLVSQPMQGPRQRGGALVRTTQDKAPDLGAWPRYTEDLISPTSVQGPARPPVQGPSMTGNPVQGRLDLRFPAGTRSIAESTTTKGASRPVGTNVAGQPYREGPMLTERNKETLQLIADEALSSRLPRQAGGVPQGQGSFFLDNVPDIFSGSFRTRPDLIRQLPPEVQKRIGITMMREAADLGPVAPRPGFGPGAGPSVADAIVEQAFGVGAAQNAAGGAQMVDLGALLSNPAVRAGLGLGAITGLGFGVTNMMSGDRTGETTAGSPPDLPLVQMPTAPLFTEADGRPLGTVDPVEAANPPALGNIDPSVAAPIVTAGNLQQQSAIREALSQNAPGAAAVMRAVEPMSPEKYRSIEEYAAAKQAYAQAKPEIQELMRFMEGQSPSIGGGLAMWAATNQPLAYQYRQRMLKNDAANQQSIESRTGTTVTSPVGTKLDAAAVGNAEAIADAALNPSQGAFDRATAFAPQVQPYLQRQAPRSAMYAGY